MGSRDVTKEETHGAMEKVESPLFEIALVLVCFDHVASFIVNTDHSATATCITHVRGAVRIERSG